MNITVPFFLGMMKHGAAHSEPFIALTIIPSPYPLIGINFGDYSPQKLSFIYFIKTLV